MNTNMIFLILGMALVTYIPRALPAVIIDKMKFSPKVEKFLSLIPYTAMAALIFPGVLTVDANLWYIGVIGGIVAILLSLIKKMPVAAVVVVSVVADMLLYTVI